MGESFHCRLLLNERFISPTENLNKDQLGYWEIRQTYIIHVSVQLSLTGREIPLLIFCKHRSKYNHFCCSELAQIVLAHCMGSTDYFAFFYSAWDPVHPWERWCSTVRNVQHFGDIITTLMDTIYTLEEGYKGLIRKWHWTIFSIGIQALARRIIGIQDFGSKIYHFRAHWVEHATSNLSKEPGEQEKAVRTFCTHNGRGFFGSKEDWIESANKVF